MTPLPPFTPVEGPAEDMLGLLETIEASAGSPQFEARRAAGMLLAAGQAIEAPDRATQAPDAIAREINDLADQVEVERQEAAGRVNAGETAAPRSRGASPS
jgi:hypothetical protein